MGRIAAATVLVVAGAWCVGFVWFVDVAFRPASPAPRADGIVVLTGGSNRIDTGLRLLEAGRAPLLLVSGVSPGTDAARLARDAGIDPAEIAGRVTVGQNAISTRGNADETVPWARRAGMRRIIVVTAFYHMPRALAELRRALPEVRFYACPVVPERSGETGRARRLELLAQEYSKFLFVSARLPYPTANLRAQTMSR